MYNISVVFTRHDTLGKCNAHALCKIIERFNPEVIFEEIPPSYFDQYYTTKTRGTLESDAVQHYFKMHPDIKHIPVDSDDVPSKAFFSKVKNMFDRLESLDAINGYQDQKLNDEQKDYIIAYGFDFLNSSECMALNDQIADANERGLTKINEEELFQVYRQGKEVHNRRENEMLQNIYQYSQANPYERALFMVGSAHMRAIVEKIEEYQKNEPFKLNWNIYNN